MTLLAPFFPSFPLPQSNFGKALKDIASRLNDADLLEWSSSFDWQEPVISLHRMRSSRYYGEEAAAAIYSPLEILVLSGDIRLVKLLLTPEKISEKPIILQGGTLRKSGYQDVPLAVGLINSAIKTGSLEMVEFVSKVALDASPQSSFQWNSNSGTYTPIVCLSDQRHLDPEVVWSMWKCLEREALRHIVDGGIASAEFSGSIKKSLRLSLLSDATRMGNCPLSLKIASQLRTTLGFSQWKDLLYEGNFEWACDFASSQEAWGRGHKEKNGSEEESAATALMSALTSQREQINSTFKGDDRRKEFLKINDGNFIKFIKSLGECTNSDRLLSLDREKVSEVVGWGLVNWSPSRAARFLSSTDAVMSPPEASAWMEKIMSSPGAISKLSLRLSGCPALQGASSRWLDIVEDKIQAWAAADWSVVGPALFSISRHLGIEDLSSSLRSKGRGQSNETFKVISSLQAHVLDANSVPSHGRSASRRI